MEILETVNPDCVTNFNRTDAELEKFLLFCMVVAGKRAHVQAKKLDDFLKLESDFKPFEAINWMYLEDTLLVNLQQVKMGKYNNLYKGFSDLAMSRLNLRTCTVEDLEKIPGIGPKTSRFFILHSRKDAKVAVLDTHVLKFLKLYGYATPLSTPSSKKLYRTLEKGFISIADDLDVSVADLDLDIWNAYNKRNYAFIENLLDILSGIS